MKQYWPSSDISLRVPTLTATVPLLLLLLLVLLLLLLLQLRYKDPGMKQYWPSSTISTESAEARADMGKAADFWQMQVGGFSSRFPVLPLDLVLPSLF
jgi:hypothetical protein